MQHGWNVEITGHMKEFQTFLCKYLWVIFLFVKIGGLTLIRLGFLHFEGSFFWEINLNPAPPPSPPLHISIRTNPISIELTN